MTEQPAVFLSAREMQILTGMSHGRTNGQIGADLFLSEDTVKAHVRRLFRRLGATDRAHAVRIGFELELLTPADGAPRPPNPQPKSRRLEPQLATQPVAVDWVQIEYTKATTLPRPTGDRHIAACYAARACPCRETSTWRWPKRKAATA